MKFGNIRPDNAATIGQVPRDDVHLLWVSDWYDGPLTGMAEVDGSKHMFDLIDRSSLHTEEEHRSYWLIQLTTDQLREEEHWQELFCRHVGTHFDFQERPPLPEEQVDRDAFYEPYNQRVPPDLSENLVVGWFRL